MIINVFNTEINSENEMRILNLIYELWKKNEKKKERTESQQRNPKLDRVNSDFGKYCEHLENWDLRQNSQNVTNVRENLNLHLNSVLNNYNFF